MWIGGDLQVRSRALYLATKSVLLCLGVLERENEEAVERLRYRLQPNDFPFSRFPDLICTTIFDTMRFMSFTTLQRRRGVHAVGAVPGGLKAAVSKWRPERR